VVTSLDKVGVHEESKEELLGDEDVEEREEEEKSIHRLQRLYLNPLVELLLLSGVKRLDRYAIHGYRSLCFARSKCYRLELKEGR